MYVIADRHAYTASDKPARTRRGVEVHQATPSKSLINYAALNFLPTPFPSWAILLKNANLPLL